MTTKQPTKCKYCGSGDTVFQQVYSGPFYHDLYIVYCKACHDDFIPVKVNHLYTEQGRLEKLEKAWDKLNGVESWQEWAKVWSYPAVILIVIASIIYYIW